MSIYMNAISNGNTIGPLVCAGIVTMLSWRWHKWIAFILTMINWIVVLLFCPETKYQRPSEQGLAVAAPPIKTEKDRKPGESVNNGGRTVIADQMSDDRIEQLARKTWTQELSLSSGIPKGINVVSMFLRPFPLIVLPAVLFSFIIYSASLAWVRWLPDGTARPV